MMLLFTLTLLFTIFGYCASIDSQSYFAICLIFRDEIQDLPEWIEYHKRMGTSKFYIFDHNSTVPAVNAIQSYISLGLVKYMYTDFQHHRIPPQIAAYNQCLQLYGRQHKFIGFIDADEYIVIPNQSLTIPDVLKDFEPFGALCLNWMMFGSSGHLVKPSGGVIANYHKCYKNEHVKVIVNTEFTLRSSGNPHKFEYLPDYFAVNTNKKPVEGFFNLEFASAFSVMYINHYNTKSLSEFIGKMHRGRGAMRNPSSYSMHYLDATNALCVDECPVLKMPVLPAE